MSDKNLEDKNLGSNELELKKDNIEKRNEFIMDLNNKNDHHLDEMNKSRYDRDGGGFLKVFLGYAPGVGKTYSMLNEGNRRLQRGEDIVIGYIEDHGRKETKEQIKDLPVVPRKETMYKGIKLEEMDLEAIIERHPQFVIVDELAHTNVPGSKNKKRYEDVLELLEHGIGVLTTVNIQHIESLNDIVEKVTNVVVRETIPDKIIQRANDLMIIDLPPESLINRLKEGRVYRSENVARSLDNFFKRGNLTALREMALREAANEVDYDLKNHKKNFEVKEEIKINEKILVCISSNPKSSKLIRHAVRTSRRYKCKCYVLIVDCTHPLARKNTPEDLKTLERNKELAIHLGAQVVERSGDSISKVVVDFAQEKGITQLVLGHSKRSKLQKFFRGSTINKILKDAENIEIRIIPYT